MNDLSNEIIKWSNDNFIKAFAFKKHNNNVLFMVRFYSIYFS